MARRSARLQGIEPTHGNHNSDLEEEEPKVRNRMDANQFAQLLQQMQAANAQLINAINDGRNQGEANQGAGNDAPFALKPYGTVLNTTNKRDAELYNQAIKPFDIKYDGSETTFYNFLNKIKQRARHLMCESIYEIEEEGTHLNLFDDYTNINTTQAKAAATTQWQNNNWEKQASYIMGIATLDSLEDEFRARLLTYHVNYTVKDNDAECADGPLVFKQITKLVQPETGYSGYSLISELHNLKLADYGYDLTKLHEPIKNLVL